MSRLFSLARKASEYIRQRFDRQTRRADAVVEEIRSQPPRRPPQPPGPYVPTLPGAPPVAPTPRQPQPPGPYMPSMAGPPPIVSRGNIVRVPRAEPQPQQPPQPPSRPPPPDQPVEEQFDDIPLLGRDASYDLADWEAVQRGMIRVQSSNVWSYYYERESRTHGILYVTFKADGENGKKQEAPGPTYMYASVPVRVYHRFQETARGSPGSAVWDELRVRGTAYGHQFIYRLVHVTGEYIPRKATVRGFRTRNLPAIGSTGRRSFRRSTLEERLFNQDYRGRPNDGRPNDGRPNDGSP